MTLKDGYYWFWQQDSRLEGKWVPVQIDEHGMWRVGSEIEGAIPDDRRRFVKMRSPQRKPIWKKP